MAEIYCVKKKIYKLGQKTACYACLDDNL